VSAHSQMPHTGTRQRGNHRGLPLRFAIGVDHHPSGRTPVSAQPRTPPTQAPANGATTGVAPTMCHCVAPSPVGADPCVRPTTNATHAANGATIGGCPYDLRVAPSPVGADPYVRPAVPHTTKADPGVAQPDARNLARSDDTEPPTIPYPYSHCWRSIPRRGCSSGSSRCEISQATHTRTRAARHRNLTHPATPVTEAAAV
jgi:hypothetical protein